MGWTNSHLYEFHIGGAGWGEPDPDFFDGPLEAKKGCLISFLADAGRRTFRYLYDFEHLDGGDAHHVHLAVGERQGREARSTAPRRGKKT